MHDRKICVGLLWHAFDSGNHGVNALTVSNRAIVERASKEAGFEPQFTIFAPGEGVVAETNDDGDRIIPINRRTIITSREYWAELSRLDCMLDISAGDSFADIYGRKRFFWMSITKYAALMRNMPLVLSPQTIGPFTRQPYKLLAGDIMSRAKLTVARDPSPLKRSAPEHPRRSDFFRRTSLLSFRMSGGQRPATEKSMSASMCPAFYGAKAPTAATRTDSAMITPG